MPQVIYLNEYQKQGVLVQKNEMDNIAYQRSGTVLPDGKFLYVIDKKGELYLADEKNSFNLNKNKMFQHTSFLSGGHVQSAGEIDIKNGKIVHINNGSGHYTPTVRQLFQAIATLKHQKLIDVDNPEFTIGVFGVSKIPNFSGNLLSLTTDEFLNHFDAIFEEESEHRNLKAFSALIKNSHLPEVQIDPYENKECASYEIINAMSLFKNAEKILIEYKNSILSRQWNPGFFNKTTLAVDNKQYVLPNDKYSELKLIDNAANSNNWVECLKTLNLIDDKIILSLLTETQPQEEQLKSTSWFGKGI